MSLTTIVKILCLFVIAIIMFMYFVFMNNDIYFYNNSMSSFFISNGEAIDVDQYIDSERYTLFLFYGDW